MPIDGGDAEDTLAKFAAVYVDVNKLAADLQCEGAAGFVTAWNDLLCQIDSPAATLRAAG